MVSHVLSQPKLIESRSFDKQNHKTSQTNDHGLSPQAALMYKITPQVMTYISYADSLEEVIPHR